MFDRKSVGVFVVLVLVVVIEQLTRQGQAFSYHRSRKFELLGFAILAIVFFCGKGLIGVSIRRMSVRRQRPPKSDEE